MKNQKTLQDIFDIFVVGWLEIKVMRFKNLIDLVDLQNDLGGQSYKSQMLLQ